MSLPEKAIKEFQEIYNKKNEKKMSFDEASEAAHNLEGLVRLLYDSALRDVRRNERLKKEPKGFHLDDGEGYTCPICKYTMSYQETWYDKRGMKCIHCQKALDKHVIPVSVLKNDKSWYSMHDFSYYFGIKSQSIRKLVRLGELKSRIIYGPNDSIRAEIFLIKDNLDVLGGKPKSY
ncbi:MAG: hypothetical protein WCT46_00785, partial [Candidatus Gracilibacteria bacterium]